jgi:hypothetical protein
MHLADAALLARPYRGRRHPEAARFERVEVFGVGDVAMFLLAVAWILWKGGPPRTNAYAFTGKRCAALAATTENPRISKIAIGALIFEFPVPVCISENARSLP